jgi:hypothetical protein
MSVDWVSQQIDRSLVDSEKRLLMLKVNFLLESDTPSFREPWPAATAIALSTGCFAMA